MDVKEPQVRNTKSRTWCFTWNNYTEDDVTNIDAWLDSTATTYVVGKEVGENGTPHLQGCMKFPNGRSFNAIKKQWGKIHLEECKNWEASIRYCSKVLKEGGDVLSKNIDLSTFQSAGTVAGRPEYILQWESYMEKTYEDVVWKKWQKDILELVLSNPSDRKVYWYYEKEGNVGKSFLTKYLDWKYNAIIANGKQADVFNQYKMYLEEYEVQPTLAIIDIPRSHQDYVCYSTLEKIKDGLIYSGKYEGGKLRLIPHHLIIFANFEPDVRKLSSDRWEIRCIDNSEE